MAGSQNPNFHQMRRLLLQSSPLSLPAEAEAPAPAPSPLCSPSKSMAVTALIILLALFFCGFSSVYARRFFASRLHRSSSSSGRRRRGTSTPLPSLPSRGLDPSLVRAFPVLRFSGGKEQERGTCVVCLGEFEEAERVKVIPRCGHAFHPPCIDAWLVASGSCPICRCVDVFGSSSSSGFFGIEVEEEGGGEEEEGSVALGRTGSFFDRGVEKDKEAEVCLRRTCSL